MAESQKENINFSIYMHFTFRVLVLGALISILPLVFINLPLRILFLGLPTFFYLFVMFVLNVAALLVCFAFASKLILSFGVKEHAFSITKR